MKVDLNCDMGEGFGLYKFGSDEEMMPYITSANIACGYHAGDPETMRKSVQLAKNHNVAIGAHPSFPDLMGFGRRYMDCSPSEIKSYVTYQLGALREFANVNKVQVQHCKPHGALYMTAMEDEVIAKAILEAIGEIDDQITVFALNNSAVELLGNKMGIPIAKEAYSDREHTSTGSIVLTREGAPIKDYNAMGNRVLRMVKDKKVKAHTGKEVSIQADTICIHSDTPGAPELARTIYELLTKNNVEVTAIKNIL